MNEQMDAAQATSTDEERTRLDRRTAMRVALGGAAAGAAFTAPRIDGLSLAPDYASAATACTLGPAGTSTSVPGAAERNTYVNFGCLNTECHALCFSGEPTLNMFGCYRDWSCPDNAGNYNSGDANGTTNGLELSLLGSKLRYAVAGSTKKHSSGVGYCDVWNNDSRSHMKVNTVASPFNYCDATMSLSCNMGGAHMRDIGNANNDHNQNVDNTNSPTSWTRSSNDNASNAWNTRWILACSGFESNMNNNGTINGVSSVTINFKCYCS